MKLLIVINFMLLGSAFSQTTFFIRPIIESKLFIGSADHTLTNFVLFDNKTASNPYFQVKNHPISFRKVIHLGVNIGITLADKHSIEIGWNQDGAGSSWQTTMMTWDTTSYGLQTYSDNQTISQSYISYNRINLNYQYLLSSHKEKTEYGISLGSDLLFNPNKKKDNPPPSIVYGSYSSPESMIHLDEDITMPINESEMFAFTRFSGFLS